MTGIIFDIKKYAVHDGPGIRTTVFLKGCPLNCNWCHNPESKTAEPEYLKVRRKIAADKFIDSEELIGREITVEELLQEIQKDILFYEESDGGVTFSGGEPFVQTDFLYSLIKKSKSRDIHTAVDTSGFTSFSNIEKVLPYTDLILYDLKVMDELEHKKYTGVSNKPIHQNLTNLSKSGANYRVRVPLIPGITDTDRNIREVINFLQSLSKLPVVDLLPYNEICEGKYERFNRKYDLDNLETQSQDKLESIVKLFSGEGLKVSLRG